MSDTGINQTLDRTGTVVEIILTLEWIDCFRRRLLLSMRFHQTLHKASNIVTPQSSCINNKMAGKRSLLSLLAIAYRKGLPSLCYEGADTNSKDVTATCNHAARTLALGDVVLQQVVGREDARGGTAEDDIST